VDQSVILTAIIATCIGFSLGAIFGWGAHTQRVQNKPKITIVPSSTLPENMMNYTHRQRTADNVDNAVRTRQGRVRFRSANRHRR
jgi:hypothetical protein